ncbi:hypothetical protein QC764_0049010 [Podospora pseudoanserina]|uniref:Uncharacterized protein n=1 Tax=Podospora pseudoanserina TaxID=2609844 RepID=A0ABR0ICE8_9PEZI|nr:hypothetical protein QC764_0049010 [Podospora pseudoanserina]
MTGNCRVLINFACCARPGCYWWERVEAAKPCCRRIELRGRKRRAGLRQKISVGDGSLGT